MRTAFLVFFRRVGILALALVFTATLAGDQLQLKSGQSYQGKFTGIENGLLKFRTDRGVIRVPITSVRDLKIPPEPPPREPPRRPQKTPAPVTAPPKNDTPKGRTGPRTATPPAIEQLPGDVPPPVQLRPPPDRTAFDILLPGLIQWRRGQRGRGGLYLAVFGLAVLNGLYAYGRLVDEFNTTRNDPLYHLYLRPRSAFTAHENSLRLSGYLLAATYAAHGLDLLNPWPNASAAGARGSAGSELGLRLAYSFDF